MSLANPSSSHGFERPHFRVLFSLSGFLRDVDLWRARTLILERLWCSFHRHHRAAPGVRGSSRDSLAVAVVKMTRRLNRRSPYACRFPRTHQSRWLIVINEQRTPACVFPSKKYEVKYIDIDILKYIFNTVYIASSCVCITHTHTHTHTLWLIRFHV